MIGYLHIHKVLRQDRSGEFYLYADEVDDLDTQIRLPECVIVSGRGFISKRRATRLLPSTFRIRPPEAHLKRKK